MSEILTEFTCGLPAGWKLERVERLCSSYRSGGTPSRGEKGYWKEGTIRFAMIEDLTGCGLYLGDTRERITTAGINASSAWIVPPGAVLVSMYATVGETAINTVPMATNQAILAMRVLPEHSAEYVAYCISYFRGWLLRRRVESTQKNVNKGILTAFEIPVPPLEEQRQIAAVLLAVQLAIERQERLITLAGELKKALMHKLFTEGTRGELLKQTEIGPVPESWNVVPLGSLFSHEPSNGLYRPQSDYGRGTLILRIDDFSNGGDVVTGASNRVNAGEGDSRRFRLAKDDIVLNRVNSLSHLGKTALIGDLDEPMLFESNMMRFRVDETRIRPALAFRVLNSAVCKSQIIGMAKRAVAQSSVNQGDVGRLLIPLPPDVAMQDEILTILGAIEAKCGVHVRTRASLNDLFRTLLHQLMTAQVRVHDLDLAALAAEGREAGQVA
jgi:type I restriction enzyme S subunit